MYLKDAQGCYTFNRFRKPIPQTWTCYTKCTVTKTLAPTVVTDWTLKDVPDKETALRFGKDDDLTNFNSFGDSR